MFSQGPYFRECHRLKAVKPNIRFNPARLSFTPAMNHLGLRRISHIQPN
jgi:hypothetical protein